MKAAIELKTKPREQYGKGAARALRRSGEVPVIIYDKGNKSMTYSIEEKEIKRAYLKGGFFGKIVELDSGKDKIYALPKELQKHPVSDRIEHADFIKVDEKSEIKVLIPVRFTGVDKCVGIKRGGNLNVVRHDLELWAKAVDIPEIIEIDITGASIGDSIHLSHINLPDGVRPTIDRDFTIATIAGRIKKDEAATTEAAAEGEESAEGGEEAAD